jgi:uncharacterized membrane protein
LETESGAVERRTRAAGLVLGVGLGGLADGIVLHQLLQWHHLISSVEPTSTVAGLEANTVADGGFHAATWLLTAAVVAMLWRARDERPSGRVLLGWVVIGWGLFNVADEAGFHALLDLHHIREGDDELTYDLAFLALGLVFVAGGWALVRNRGPHGP